MKSKKANTVWGKPKRDSIEIKEAKPCFSGNVITPKDWSRLMQKPHKFLMYRFIKKHFDKLVNKRSISEPFRLLVIGCEGGASLVDFKKMFGRQSDVVGADDVKLQIDITKTNIKKYSVKADIEWYDGKQLPFSNGSFDAVYSAGDLGQINDFSAWLREVARIIDSEGKFALFVNNDYGRDIEIRSKKSGFEVRKKFIAFWVRPRKNVVLLERE